MLNRTGLIDSSDSSPGNPAGVIPALRAATTERHELLHRIMPLSLDSAALRDYLLHIALLREWLAPLEAWLGQFSDGPQSAALAPRLNRLALIDADLAHDAARDSMGAREPTDADAASHPQRWHGDASAAYRWGACYVVEGSQLGGAVLYARLKDRFASHPLGFLSAGRESLGPRWQAFVRAMSAEVNTPSAIDDACRGAADAFDRLIELAQRPTRAICASAG